MCGHVCAMVHVVCVWCGVVQRQLSRVNFLFSLQTLSVQLRSSGLAVSAFTPWAISQAKPQCMNEKTVQRHSSLSPKFYTHYCQGNSKYTKLLIVLAWPYICKHWESSYFLFYVSCMYYKTPLQKRIVHLRCTSGFTS